MDTLVQFLEKLETHPELSDEFVEELHEAKQELEAVLGATQVHSEDLFVETLGGEDFESVDLAKSSPDEDFGDFGRQVELSEASDVAVEYTLPVATQSRYEDLGLLTRGGMGEIRRMRDDDLNRVAIMKVIRPERYDKRIALLRFIEEAQVTAQLAHPGIPAVHELGRLADGRLYFTMREVQGRTLDEAIEDVHRDFDGDLLAESESGWSLRGLIEALEDICATLGFAHSQGVVHRDLKPQNIMVGDFDVVQVLDWGIAKVAGRTVTDTENGDDPLAAVETNLEREETRAGVVMGTAAYMAPEQVRGQTERIQPATDVFALGVLLYEMLVGRPPFAGDATLKILLQILEGPKTPVTDIEHVPEVLAEICARALSPDPKDRFANAARMGEAIEDWLEGTARRERAHSILAGAVELDDKMEALRQDAEWLERRSRDLLKEIAPNAPVDDKRKAWEHEDRARRLRRKLARLEVEYVKQLREAHNLAPNLAEARQRLADYYRAEHERAELAGDREHAEETLAYLKDYDDGRYAEYLSGHGRLSLTCHHPGARASLFRFEKRDRRLAPEFVCELGELPLEEVELACGSYLVRITSNETIEVDYP
ncbi:MAG: serine/threonine protein kinase, partial [Persicimonas sp.]